MRHQAKVKKAIRGETIKPTKIAGMAAIVGPMLGTSSKKPARIANGRANFNPKSLKPK
ncbi:MAG: hypothetical protein ABH867_04755 [Patescibacteria group bacterium]